MAKYGQQRHCPGKSPLPPRSWDGVLLPPLGAQGEATPGNSKWPPLPHTETWTALGGHDWMKKGGISPLLNFKLAQLANYKKRNRQLGRCPEHARVPLALFHAGFCSTQRSLNPPRSQQRRPKETSLSPVSQLTILPACPGTKWDPKPRCGTKGRRAGCGIPVRLPLPFPSKHSVSI